MLTLTGTVVNVFETPKGTLGDGKEYGGKWKVQFMAEQLLRNGQKKAEIVDLSIDDPRPFEALKGQETTVDVGVGARASRLFFYHIKA